MEVDFRFIPTREGNSLHASYQLTPDSGKEAMKAKSRRKSNGPGTDQDVRRGE